MMKPEQANEFTDGLGQVFAGAVRLAGLAVELDVPQALGLTPEEWAQRRLAGHVRLSIAERRAVVDANPERSSRELGEALGVDHATIARDRQAVADATAPTRDEPSEQAAPVANATANGRDRSALFTSETAEWSTPQDLFDELDAELGFDLDVCATAANAKCERYFTEADDGLTQRWVGACWMNPPYGDAIGRWIAKAWSSAEEGATVACLVPARVDTGWWWDYCRRGEIRFLRGRLKFGGAEASAPFPSALVVFPREPCVLWWER
ncbi:MAG TPA: DNA N-6-adenine-methyltransferase [Solirubrobacteraceae bacterium]|nr:DNA N-6-adenine-methyltransferase [Solirubrobacteraceae bacterium]